MREYPILVVNQLKEVTADEYHAVVADGNVRVYNFTALPDLHVDTGQYRYYFAHYGLSSVAIQLDDLAPTDPYQYQLWLTYHCYWALVHIPTPTQLTSFTSFTSLTPFIQFKTITFEAMTDSAKQLTTNDLSVHWVWIRDRHSYLPNKIMVRVRSWLVLNPEFQFYLSAQLTQPPRVTRLYLPTP